LYTHSLQLYIHSTSGSTQLHIEEEEEEEEEEETRGRSSPQPNTIIPLPHYTTTVPPLCAMRGGDSCVE
jgi:hypothetical protein